MCIKMFQKKKKSCFRSFFRLLTLLTNILMLVVFHESIYVSSVRVHSKPRVMKCKMILVSARTPFFQVAVSLYSHAMFLDYVYRTEDVFPLNELLTRFIHRSGRRTDAADNNHQWLNNLFWKGRTWEVTKVDNFTSYGPLKYACFPL